jgi:dipeptidase E
MSVHGSLYHGLFASHETAKVMLRATLGSSCSPLPKNSRTGESQGQCRAFCDGARRLEKDLPGICQVFCDNFYRKFALITAGLVVLLDSFARLALHGCGTPAPALRPQPCGLLAVPLDESVNARDGEIGIGLAKTDIMDGLWPAAGRPGLILGGGGSADEELVVLDYYARLIGRGGNVLYLPVAAPDSETNIERYRRWIASVLPPRRLRVGDIWPAFEAHKPDELDSFDSVFLGGGNTFRLLQQLRASGFAQALIDFCRSGRTIYGGSAGAIVFGRDISSCAYHDANDVGLTDTQGLDLCGGYSVWCHFEPEQEESIERHVRASGESLIVLASTSGAVVTEEGVFGLGSGAAFVWSPAYRRALAPAPTVD